MDDKGNMSMALAIGSAAAEFISTSPDRREVFRSWMMARAGTIVPDDQEFDSILEFTPPALMSLKFALDKPEEVLWARY